jgi:hypothetical protein
LAHKSNMKKMKKLILGLESKTWLHFLSKYNINIEEEEVQGIKVIGICTTHSKKQFKEWGVDISINDFEEYIDNYRNA